MSALYLLKMRDKWNSSNQPPVSQGKCGQIKTFCLLSSVAKYINMNFKFEGLQSFETCHPLLHFSLQFLPPVTIRKVVSKEKLETFVPTSYCFRDIWVRLDKFGLWSLRSWSILKQDCNKSLICKFWLVTTIVELMEVRKFAQFFLLQAYVTQFYPDS